MTKQTMGLTTYRVHLDDRRRPTLPPALLAEAGIAPGAHEMIARVDGRGRVVLEDPMTLLLALQDEVADGKARLGIDVDLVDDLLDDRASDQSLA
jgi:hypothetical protein